MTASARPQSSLMTSQIYSKRAQAPAPPGNSGGAFCALAACRQNAQRMIFCLQKNGKQMVNGWLVKW